MIQKHSLGPLAPFFISLYPQNMSKNFTDSLTEQLRRVLKDAIDYFQSVVTLLQARLTEFALSSVVFLLLLSFASLMALACFLMFNIALGVWISHLTGSAGWSILILGSFYGILSILTGFIAFQWLNKLKS